MVGGRQGRHGALRLGLGQDGCVGLGAGRRNVGIREGGQGGGVGQIQLRLGSSHLEGGGRALRLGSGFGLNLGVGGGPDLRLGSGVCVCLKDVHGRWLELAVALGQLPPGALGR